MKFTIGKNRHYSRPYFISFHRNIKELYLNVKFDRNCWYERDEVEYTGINKIYGLGYGLNHHKNSIRLGWQPDFEDDCKKKIIIYAYWYDQSVDGYQKKEIGKVDISQVFESKIEIHRNKYNVILFENNYEIKKTHHKRWGMWLKPYFGGKSKAPNKMSIFIKKHN